MKTISKRSLILTSITSLVLVMSVNTHAKIYKWTDANGQTHYTAQPPEQKKKRIKVENIEDKIRSNAGKYRAPTKSVLSKESEENTANEEETEKELAGPNKQLIKYCDSQRNNLEQLKKNFRNVWIDVKGNKTNLNQEQRQEKVTFLQNKLKEDCSEVAPSKKQ